MGFQFVHIETYSRKASKSGRTVSNVLDEAQRRPEACTHVAAPGAPTLVFGCPLDELRVRHDQVVAAGRSAISGGKARAIRSDQHTMLTIVASHPATRDQVAADPAVAVEVNAWQVRAVEWMQGLWGDRLQSVVRHDDEGHPHLHAYVLPDAADAKAKAHHPGCIAKDGARAIALALGSDAKVANAKGDAAYRTAMRAMQNGYFERVGIASGMARLGPGRRRLDRGAWRAEQAVMTATAIALRVAEEAKTATSEAQAKAADLGDRGRVFVVKARKAASEAKTAADAAQASLRDAEKAEARIRQRVGVVSELLEEVQEIRVELAHERVARHAAEVEREKFRGLWAEADNALIAAKRDRKL